MLETNHLAALCVTEINHLGLVKLTETYLESLRYQLYLTDKPESILTLTVLCAFNSTLDLLVKPICLEATRAALLLLST